MFIDAHNHILDYLEERYKKCEFEKEELKSLYPPNFDVAFCASSNEAERFIKQKEIISSLPCNIKPHLSFGIHPQAPSINELIFLEKLLQNKQIIAIGECGFDLFCDEYKEKIDAQKEVWNAQIELAKKYDMPVIIHCRRALHLIFEDSKNLAKLKAVIFHGWPGNKREASSLLRRKVNAYFCIGKALLRGQKSQIEMAGSFDLTRLLTETDAPYMKLKNEELTCPSDIESVFKALASCRKEKDEDVKISLSKNFSSAFFLADS